MYTNLGFSKRVLIVFFFGFVFCYSTYSLSDVHSDEKRNTISKSNASIVLVDPKINSVLIDLQNFEYLINHESCYSFQTNKNSTKKLLTAVVLVHSAPNNLAKRNIIRETWGQKDPRVRLFFLLGAVKSPSLQTQLELENTRFGDIIQGNFLDTYRNLTYKHVMALKWFTYNCPNVKFLLKADDDVFINTPVLYNLLETDYKNKEDFVFCNKRIKEPVLRNVTKWAVTLEEYPDKYYPIYCPGYSIVFSNDTVVRLYQRAEKTKYFWIDDVYVTGTLTQQLNLNITSIEKYFLRGNEINDLINGKINLNSIKPMFLFASPNLNGKEIQELWKVVESSFKLN